MEAATLSARRWSLDFSQHSLVSKRDELDPPGYATRVHEEEKTPSTKQKATSDLLTKKVWDLAKSPSNTILMTLFMSWMSGSSVNIFSIMLTMYSFLNPLKAIFGTNTAFGRYDDGQISLLLPKLLYIAINMIPLGIAAYKCSVLGLLPTTTADWAHLISVKRPLEFSAEISKSIL